MTWDKIWVFLLTITGIIFTYWFFLMKKEQAVSVKSDSVDIKVEGGYTPEVISIPKGQTTILNFTRTDPTSCLEEVILGDFKVRKELPLNKTVSVAITPPKAGTYTYSCGMNMYHGKIKVV